MAAETLLREVEDKRKSALAQLDADLEAKISDIRQRTSTEKQRILENAKRQSQEQAQREKIRIIGAAKLQAKKLVFDATEKMLENNLVALRQALAEYVNSRDYQVMLPKMADYASNRLGGEINVVCRKDDTDALEKAGVEIASSDLMSLGGFKAEKKDGTLELDLTFEELLRNREEEIRRAILGGD